MISFARQTFVDNDFCYVFKPLSQPHHRNVVIDRYHPTIFRSMARKNIDTGIVDILKRDGFKVDYLQEPLTDSRLTNKTNILVMIGMKRSRKSPLSGQEILTLTRWLSDGGSLLLVVGHYPNGEGQPG